MLLVISASLSPDSNSRLLAQEAVRVLQADGQAVQFLDLREHALPWCDGDAAYRDPVIGPVRALIAGADAIIVATPIYNYDGNAALKNLIELTGRAWENKAVGFLCAAGGQRSYMSIMGLANSLMLDFRNVIVPRFVYATGDAFADGRLVDPEQIRRVAELARMTARLGSALKAA
jgi:NAD(P)H-dependent FMN reductase